MVSRGSQTALCEECNTAKALKSNFYTPKTNNHTKKAYIPICKKCMAEKYDVLNVQEFVHLFKLCDIPFLQNEWDNLYKKHQYDTTFNFISVFGRYVKLMKGPKYRTVGWDDHNEMKVVQEKVVDKETGMATMQDKAIMELKLHEETVTEGDIAFMMRKWGKTYSIEDLIIMETLWGEMMDSYDIQSASHKDYLKKICKASLRLDQAIDMGDDKAFKEYGGMYDKLMKSANFTEAQQKENGNNFIDSFSEFFTLLEEQGFIDPHPLEVPKDVVDATIKNMNRYTRSLVLEETSLADMTEEAIKKMLSSESMEEGEIDDDEDTLIIPTYDDEIPIDNDLAYMEEEARQKKQMAHDLLEIERRKNE